jgi:poly(glycerol-phosphate) alpha-glucosyltransferase
MHRVIRRGTLHLPVNTLALRRGGLVKAVMLRANALASADASRHVVIEVLSYQRRLEEDVAELVRRGFLDPRVHVRSVLRSFDPSRPDGSDADPIPGCAHHGIPFDGSQRVGHPVVDPAVDPRAVVLADPGARTIHRRLLNRLHPTVRTLDDAGRLQHVDVYDRRAALLHRIEYGSGDRVNRILDFRKGDSRPVAQRWIGVDGRCFLAVWLRPGGRDWGTAYVAHDGLKALATPKQLYVLALEHALRDERDPVLFSEFRESLANLPGRGFDDIALGVRHATLRRVAVIHSNHALSGNRTLPLRSSPNFAALLTDLVSWDMVVTATEAQRDAIAEQYGNRDRLMAIPHYAPDSPEHLDARAYDPNRFVLVARIHRKKRVDEAIHAFRLVVDQNPEARLEIFGFGYGDELQTRIRSLVDELGLGKHIDFRGFIEDTASIYAGACASLQTSESEGFGMALLESLAGGIPVVAYDVAYGASEAIRDGIDGYVVPWGDRAAMAQRLLALSTDPELRARLAAEGPAGAARFSRDRYVAEWTAALAGLPVLDSEATVLSARVLREHLELTADGQGDVVLRPRGGGDDIEAPIIDGAARVPLPALTEGKIVDVYLRDERGERRALFAGRAESDDPTWLVYATAYGNLSVKRIRLGKLGAVVRSTGGRLGSVGNRRLRWVTSMRGRSRHGG